MAERKIAILTGSDSDFGQCLAGFKFLEEQERLGVIEIFEIKVASIHRNTLEVIDFLSKCLANQVDVIITGAGWANHLSGTADAYLRYTLGKTTPVVVAVAFEDKDNEKHTLAAMLSITEVPGTKTVFQTISGDKFVGAEGFLNACRWAAFADLPEIALPKPKPTKTFSLSEVIARAESLQ